MSATPKRFTSSELIGRLEAAVPEFRPDTDDVRDGLNYLVVSSLMTFVEQTDPERDSEVLKRIFDFLETAAGEGDDEVVGMIRDAIWGLATYSDVTRYRHLMSRKSGPLLKQTS